MILMYHKVSLESPTVWWVTADAFWRQMEQLTRYEVVPLSKYDPSNPRHVVITFDGAYENVYTFALPILRRFRHPFELFVVGDLIGRGNEFDQPTEPPARFATPEQLKAMVQCGGRLQWHTRTHPDLAKVDGEGLDRELWVPDEIRGLDPDGFRWFAYPHGRNPVSVVDAVRARFDGAVSCVDGDDRDRYQFNRVTVTNETSFAKSTVSLIIPNYNYGRFAAEAIESALAQTVAPKEILFIDDCSDDISMDVAKRYEGRIRVVRNERNLGIVDNFNKAVSLTSGNYICFLGADNRFRSDYVEQCQRLLDGRPDVAIAYTNVVFFGPRAEVMAVKLGIPPVPHTTNMFLWRLPEFDEKARQLLETGSCIHGSSMYRRSAFEQVGGYKKDGPQEDHNLFRRMVRAGWEAVLCPEFLLEYRQHSRDQADTKVNDALEVVHLRRENKRLSDERNALEKKLGSIESSPGWLIGRRVESIIGSLLPAGSARRSSVVRIVRAARRIRRDGVAAFLQRFRDEYGPRWWRTDPYMPWIRKHEPRGVELGGLRREAAGWSYRPKISIVTPVFNPRRYDLTQCIQSVIDQAYDNWELILIDGGSDHPHVHEIMTAFGKRDARVRCDWLPKNLGIAGNSNEALRRATGEYVAFLDHDDMLAPFALYEVVRVLNQDQTIDALYSDEDKIPARGGRRYDPALKSDWAPDTMLSYNYLCHFAVVRRLLLQEIGSFREGYDGAQDYDLILRIALKTTKIKHIPKVLYHWRAAESSTAKDPTRKPYAADAARRAIGDYLRHRGLEAEVVDGYLPTTYRVRYRVRGNPKVSIIVPTRDKVDLLRQCVESVLAKTSYVHYEIVIVDNQSQEESTRQYYQSLKANPRIRILSYDAPFNFSAINNFAVRATDGPHLLFLNNDTEVIAPEWLSAMLEYSQRNDVGGVGARLYYPDETIQHAGLIIGIGGVAGHAHRLFERTNDGYMGRIKVVQNLSAVTGACLMVRRSVFDEVGGFDERLSHAFNDVDLCLKIREKGHLIVYTPYAELYHHESASRGPEDTPERKARFAKEVEIMESRWKHVLEAGDPYYNCNLALDREDFSIRL
jgi:GT2 family glycosyltransferase